MPAGAADVSVFALFKGWRFIQTNATSSDPISPDPFLFEAFVSPAANGLVVSAALKLPNGTTNLLSQNSYDSDYKLKQSFASQVSLDAAYPSGVYNVILNTINDGLTTNSLTLPANNFPNGPRFSNYNAAQAIDANANFTLTWDPFVAGTTNDFIQLEIQGEFGDEIFRSPSPGEPDYMDGTATSVIIPANTLQAGQQYRTRLTFYRLTTFDTIIYPGAFGVAGFTAQTEVYIQTSSGPNVQKYFVVKSQSFNQTSSSPPAPNTARPYAFGSFIIKSSSNSVNTATLRYLPSGTNQNYIYGDNELFIEADFLSQAALDAAYPNGSYRVTMNTLNDGTKTSDLSVTGDTYPATPRISNYPQAQTIDAAADFLLTWDSFAGGTADDFIQLQFEDCQGNGLHSPDPGEPGALTGTNNSITLSAGLLQSGRTYQAELKFFKRTSIDTNSYPGVRGLAAYGKTTKFTLVTAGTPVDCTGTSLNLAFNFPHGNFGSGTNGAISFPNGFAYYFALFNVDNDINFPTNAYFTGPPGSGLTNTPSSYFFSGGNGGGYGSPQVNTPPFPPGGLWTVNYKGTNKTFILADPDAANKQIMIVPTVVTNPAGLIQRIDWVYKNTNGNTVSAQPFMQKISISIDGFGGRLYDAFDLSPLSNSHTLIQNVAWTNTGMIFMNFTDANNYNYTSFWTRDNTPLQIFNNSQLPDGAVGTTYSYILNGGGGNHVYSWSIQSNSLPAGLSLNATTGEIFGTPTQVGTNNFVIRFSDTSPAFIDKQFTLIINTTGGPPQPPTFNTFGHLPDRTFQMSFQGQIGRSYRIDASTTLTNWTDIGIVSPNPTNGVTYYRDLGATNYPRRFYRATLLP